MTIRRRPLVAALSCLAFVAGLALPVFKPHDVGKDVDAGWGGSRLSAHITTQFERVHDRIADEHCALCHWSRLVSSAVTGTTAIAPAVLRTASVRSTLTPVAVAGAAGAVAPRGPPRHA